MTGELSQMGCALQISNTTGTCNITVACAFDDAQPYRSPDYCLWNQPIRQDREGCSCNIHLRGPARRYPGVKRVGKRFVSDSCIRYDLHVYRSTTSRRGRFVIIENCNLDLNKLFNLLLETLILLRPFALHQYVPYRRATE